jgi:hypothetical protein
MPTTRLSYLEKIKANICLFEPKKPFSVKKKGFLNLCAHLGSNQGPKDYESSTLTD